jgi:Rho termination factor, N-terminal domain
MNITEEGPHIYPGPFNPANELELKLTKEADQRATETQATSTTTTSETPVIGDEAVDYESMTVAELKDLAAQRNVHLTSDMRKDEIIAALENA